MCSMSLLGKVLLGLYIASRTLGGGTGQVRTTEGYYVRDRAMEQAAVRLAILPFDNLSDDTQADRKVLGILVTHVLSKGTISVVEPSVMEATLSELRLRPPLTSIQAKQLAAKLGTRLIMIGTITEYGQPRGSSPALTVAMNARIVDTTTDSIVWAAAATKTGKPDDSLFGSGIPPSLTKLTHQSVEQLLKLLEKAKAEITRSAGPPGPVPAAPGDGGVQPNQTAPAAPTSNETSVTADPARTADESKELTTEEMAAYLPLDLGGAKRASVTEADNCVRSLDAIYQARNTQMHVRLTDQVKATDAAAVAKVAGKDGTAGPLGPVTGYTTTSEFGFVHVNAAAGRFTFAIKGPADETELIQKIASALAKSLKAQ